MKVLIDTNILLDVSLASEPFFLLSDRVVRWCEDHPGDGFVAWHTLSNVYYVLRRNSSDAHARGFAATILEHLQVARTRTPEAKHALYLPTSDYEDALQISAALAAGADAIVSRDYRDFADSIVPALSPEQFLATAPL